MPNLELPIKVEGILFCRFNNTYQFLLLKRMPEDGGFWQPLTGTLEFDESLHDCLLRELTEEIGISEPTVITEEVYRFSWVKEDYTIVELVYGVELPYDAPIILSHEHDAYTWVSYEEAMASLAKDNNKRAFQEFKQKFMGRED